MTKIKATTSGSRSNIMRAVRSKDTAPELLVRKITFAQGYRYRLHRVDLPGKPDLTFVGRRKVIFVNGCFWHGHDCKRGSRVPKTNTDYWMQKVARNVARDQANISALKILGWDCLVLWECKLGDKNKAGRRIRAFLD